MPLSRETLTRLLEQANAARDQRTESLSKAGITGKAVGTDPRWRKMNAECRQIQRRIDAVAAVEANNAAVAQRKAEKAAAE